MIKGSRTLGEGGGLPATRAFCNEDASSRPLRLFLMQLYGIIKEILVVGSRDSVFQQ